MTVRVFLSIATVTETLSLSESVGNLFTPLRRKGTFFLFSLTKLCEVKEHISNGIKGLVISSGEGEYSFDFVYNTLLLYELYSGSKC